MVDIHLQVEGGPGIHNLGKVRSDHTWWISIYRWRCALREDIHDQASLIISWPGISLLYIYICTVKY
jgi:hypothetical protein